MIRQPPRSTRTDPLFPYTTLVRSDPGFSRALANGGVTTLEVLPGSANLFGGRSVVLKNVPGRTVQEMKFPGAPYGLKMACGENPKRVYGAKGRMPRSEEHTSELQSLMRISYAVFCLKTKIKKTHH